LATRFYDVLQRTPHPFVRNQQFMDETYTRLLNLKALTSDYGLAGHTSSFISRLYTGVRDAWRQRA
jgi:hypothetical protein